VAGGGVGGDAPHCGRVGGGCSREMDGSVEMPCGCPRVSARAAPPPRTGLLLHARMPPRASPSRRGVFPVANWIEPLGGKQNELTVAVKR
jgi:hypothetical protein